ncbi:MAG: FAD-dependent oxidoreductase [Lachnospiraceae bacterium]|nr:FAD-dependent oxidoreductase [Lachnospiraceae bacterium]MEE3460375.1 FAD-dependent oxidoreductase [Lachnospiraceae bacterium]
MERFDLIVVGAGPSGLSAAIEAAKAGAQVVVFDENMRPGGQLFKQIHKFFGSKEHRARIFGIGTGQQEHQSLNLASSIPETFGMLGLSFFLFIGSEFVIPIAPNVKNSRRNIPLYQRFTGIHDPGSDRILDGILYYF